MTVMRAKYEQEVKKALMEKYGYKSPMQIPKLDKIVINIGPSGPPEDLLSFAQQNHLQKPP